MSDAYWGSPQAQRITVVDVDDSGPQQLVHATGLMGQDIGQMVRIQHHGESSVPQAGAEGYAIAVGGSADRFFALGLESPTLRPTGQPIGAKVLYDAAGNVIRMFGTGVDMNFGSNPWTVECNGITIVSNGTDIIIKAPGHKIYLGPGPYSPVVLVAGPSTQIFGTV